MEFSNYLKIKKNIPSFVNLLAVSKGFKSDQIRNIYRLGQKDFGESKLQEGLEKQELLKDIGEKELIKRLAEFKPKNQISDDCAFIKTSNKDFLINSNPRNKALIRSLKILNFDN